ncbi:MAG: hypothetical protein H7Y86_18350 [Rhizobacter sp.]|nr:hypothetical protein [Ferruginibacter sp.]
MSFIYSLISGSSAPSLTRSAKLGTDKAHKQVMALRAVLFNKVREVEEWEDPNTPGRVEERAKLAIEVVLGYRANQRKGVI